MKMSQFENYNCLRILVVEIPTNINNPKTPLDLSKNLLIVSKNCEPNIKT